MPANTRGQGRSSSARPARSQSRGTVRGRTPISARRKAKPPQSTMGKALSGLAGLVPGAAAKAAPTKRGGKIAPAGIAALVAGAAGVALKNRDRLTGMIGRGGRPASIDVVHHTSDASDSAGPIPPAA